MNDRLQYPFKNDHDVFIALIEDFNASISSLDRRMVDDHSATLEVKELIRSQYDGLTKRIESLERDLVQVSPQEIASLKKEVERHTNWINGFNATKHIAWVIASTGFIILGYYIPSIAKFFKLIGK